MIIGFIFASTSGQDTIADFDPVVDIIQIQANINNTGIASFQDIQARMTATAEGTVIDLGDTNTLLISGVSTVNVGTEDFIFS